MMRLYVMSCGSVRSRKKIYIPNAPKEEYMEAPMPIFLVKHPSGNLLFDTGPNPEVFINADAVWGGLAKAFQPIGDKDSGVVAQLKKLGFTPDDIRYVVNSHLHFDHSGGNRFFPDATFLVSQKELKCARRPDLQGKGYFRSDWDHTLDYRTVEGELDVFGDGRLIIYPMPGHTPGHQVMLVRLEKHDPILLSGDSAPLRENFEQRVLPRNHLNNEEARLSIDRLHELVAREDAMIIYGHDEEYWESLRMAPAFYE